MSGFGKLDGKYYIDTVTHTKDASGSYTVSLDMHLCVIVNGVTVATVESGNTTKESRQQFHEGEDLYHCKRRYLVENFNKIPGIRC